MTAADLAGAGKAEPAIAREVLSRIYELGQYGPWTSFWVVTAVAWWSGQTSHVQVTKSGIDHCGEVQKPEYTLRPSWRPPTIPFAVFAWLMAQLTKFMFGKGMLGYNDNSDKPLVDSMISYTYAALCDAQPHLSQWQEMRMRMEEDLCHERKGEEVDGTATVAQFSELDQIMHAEYSKFVLDLDEKEMQLQNSPADCTLWCAPESPCASYSCVDPLKIGHRLSAPEPPLAAGGTTEDSVAADQNAHVFAVLPPSPDLVLLAVKSMVATTPSLQLVSNAQSHYRMLILWLTPCRK